MIVTLLLGMAFGFILQFARLNQYNTISGMAILKDYTVAKAIATAIGVGAILINIEVALGWASFHPKPILLTGVMAGGLIFGAGMAILGYCPGTLAISLGEGSMDALVGILGAMAGGVSYTLLAPEMSTLNGPNLGTITLHSLIGDFSLLFFLLVFLIGGGLIAVAFWLNRLEKSKSLKWLYAGIGLAVLNSIMFLPAVNDKGVGASTVYPYLGDVITGVTNNAYFEKISSAGSDQLVFLGGAMLIGLIMAIAEKRFRFVLIHANWKQYKNNSPLSRIIWAFIGGFILIFGARFAGGCTSGHVITGGMQIAISSFIFAAFVFAGLLITGRLFYRR